MMREDAAWIIIALLIAFLLMGTLSGAYSA